MAKLSLVMIVKNESKSIERCLESVKNVVDEMIVVDTGSTDNTKELALSHGAKLYDFPWINDFSAARNFALNKASGEWNLVLDADEYLLEGTKSAIDEFINHNDAIGRIKIINKFSYANEVRHSNKFISRLFPKGVFFEGKIHEQLVSDLPRINTNIEVYHEGYFQTNKTERNLALLLNELNNNQQNTYIMYQIARQYRLSKQYHLADEYFHRCYGGIKEGVPYRESFIIDYLYNIISYGNLHAGIAIIAQEEECLSDNTDFHFVCGLFYMELIFSDLNRYLEMLPRIEVEYKKCLELGDRNNHSGVVGTGSFLPAYNLGVFYETIGQLHNARVFYEQSSNHNYEPAKKRLKNLLL